MNTGNSKTTPKAIKSRKAKEKYSLTAGMTVRCTVL